MPDIQFQALDAKIIPHQLQALLKHQQQQIKEEIQTHDAKALLGLLNRLGNDLEKFWAPVAHLNSVLGNEAWRNCYQQCLPLLTAHETFIYQNQDLYKKLKDSHEKFTFGETKMQKDFLLGCQLSGIDLPEDKRQEVKNIFERLDELSQQFQNNIVDSMKKFRFHTNQLKDLEGIPEHVILNAQKKAEIEKISGYILTLDQPTYIAVISYAKNQEIRKLFFKAYGTRASDQSDFDENAFDNTEIIQEILEKRQALSQLVGLENYAAYSLSNKMAQKIDRVKHFLDRLKQEVKPVTRMDVQEIERFAQSKGYLTSLQPWDMSYFIQMRQQELFSIDQEALRDYFPLSHVMKGLNQLFQKLYGLELSKVSSNNMWHPDVECYVFKQKDQVIGHVYCDWFSREGKLGGAWMDTLQTRCRLTDGTIQSAITTLTCNFAQPAPNQEAGLTHEELLTLLHEFGHCMHHILSEVDEFSVSGVHGVEWDAVELPSLWMENWGWIEYWLKIFSCHVKTKKSLPHELFAQLLNVKNDLIGLYLSRQILFASYDIFIHSQMPPQNKDEVHQQYLKLLKEVAVWPVDFNQRFPQNFSHVFAGGYAAGYYSYLWADVLSSDAFEWFAQDLEKISEKGQHFRKEIMSKGGSISALDAFIAFRGREPDENALLRAYGLSQS